MNSLPFGQLKSFLKILIGVQYKKEEAGRSFGAPCLRLLQTLLVSLDHLLDHLAADGAGFAGGQVTVVAVGQVHANLPWCLFYIVNVKLPRMVLKLPCFEGNFQGIQDAGTQ